MRNSCSSRPVLHPIFTFLFVLAFSLITLSCGNIFNPDSGSSSGTVSGESSGSNSQSAVIFRGTVAYSGAIPSEIATSDSLSGSSRQSDNLSSSAVPVFDTSEYEYFARAVEIDSTGNAVTDGETSTGTFSDSSAPVFEISLATGKIWKITCGVKKKPASADAPFNQNDVCLEASFDNDGNPLTASSPVITHTFYPTPVSGGTGSLHLSMNMPTAVTSVTTECISADPEANKASWASSVTSSTTMLTASDLPSGIYEVAIKFYKTHETFGSYLVYSTVQSINVIKGMQTNTWVSDGTSLFTTSGSTTTFNLTDDIINNYLSTQLYVGKPAGLASRTDVLATDTNAGSAYSPLATLRAALNRIESVGKSTETYTIHVSGEITGTATLSSSLNTKAKAIIIEGLQGSSTDILNGNSEGTVLTISTTRPVTINNLTLTGGDATNGGGILIDSGAKVTLGNGTVISGNTATNGGAVHLSGEDSTLSLKGSACIPYGVTIGGTTQTGPGKNDVYLATGKTLSVTGSLNPPALANGTVAAITMESWNRGATIVTAANGVSFTDSIAEYFTITAPEAGGWEKLIDSSRKKIKVDAPIFIGNSTVAGDDTNNSGTLSSPFKTLARACQEMNDSETDYTIKVIGTTSPVAQEIPASLLNSGSGDSTKNYAHSVTIIGVTQSGSGTQAEINRGLASSTADADGSVLAVNSTVPVTLKNLKITGGNTTTNGGGIFISSGATVYIDDDSVIQNNKAEQKGGGIYNQGTLYIKNANIMANTAANGGAIALAGDTAHSGITQLYSDASIVMGAGTAGSPLNDIYLMDGKKLTLTESLSQHNTTDKKIALTAEKPSKKVQLIDGTSSILSSNYNKFELKAPGFFLAETGKPALKHIVTEIYVASSSATVAGSDPSGDTAVDLTWNNSTFAYNESTDSSQTKPFATIEKAAQFITYQESAEDYTIYIDGVLTGAQLLANNDFEDADADNPISLNPDTAASILLTGKNPLPAAWPESGEIADILNGNFGDTAVENGSTLTIGTAKSGTGNSAVYVPVTIKNLGITGGNTIGNGGGVNIKADSYVTIHDGTHIYGNTATALSSEMGYNTGCGGGIYSKANTLNIFGSAVIGMKDATAVAQSSSAASTGRNKAKHGGGIFASAKLFLGSEETPLTGGVYFNYATSGGGGIQCNSTLTMGSGRIAFNHSENCGGGIDAGIVYIYGDALIGGINTPNKSDNLGGGVWNSNGKIYMGYSASGVVAPFNEGKGIIGNIAGRGGGIGTDSATFYMASGTISHNTATSSFGYGGGICFLGYYNTGSRTISGGTISNNKALYGGGIYSENSFTMTGGVIGDSSKTEAAASQTNCSNYATQGGAIYIKGSSSYPAICSLTGGTIAYNYASESGGGIFIADTSNGTATVKNTISYNGAGTSGAGIYTGSTTHTITLDGATISENLVPSTGNGGAIYNLSGDKLSMKGAVNITYGAGGVTGSGKNDVYLGANDSGELSKIMLAGALTAPAGGKIATIVPSSYSSGAQILDLKDGVTDTSIADEYTKFALADETYFAISSTGCLAFAGDLVTEFYVSASGSDSNNGSSPETAMATITNALKRITLQGMADQDYTINVIGTLTGAQVIPASDADNNISINAQTAKSITLCGEGLGAELNGGFDSSNKGTTLTISTTQPVTIENLTIKGGYATSGGGLYVYADANVQLTEGVNIKENHASDEGGGIYTKGNLTLNGAKVNQNIADSGGGIYIYGGKVFIYGNTTIGEDDSAYSEDNKLATSSSYGNKANSYCGGIYNDNGLLAIGYSSYTSETDNTPAEFTGKICRNYAGSGTGGITSRATTVIGSGTISYNNGSSHGGGVNVCNSSGSTFIMNGGSIEHNKANYGAGLYITEKGNVTINGGSISYNTAANSSYGGGGIYLNKSSSYSATLNIYGGTISNNTAASGKGGAIYAMNGCSFNMKGSAYIPYGVDDETGAGETGAGKNDLYLEDGMSVTIAGKLTPPDACTNGIIATIKPQTYSTETTVLTLSTSPAPNPSTTLADEYTKFALIQNSADPDTEWRIKSNGLLVCPVAISTLTEDTIPTAADYPELKLSSGSELSTVAGWVSSSNLQGINITLTEDIEFTEAFATSIGTGWDGSSGFSGTFDGGGHTISGFNTAGQTTTYPSLFGCVNSKGTIKNVILEGTSNCGGIVGCSYGTIENCESRVTITGATNNAAGIVCSLRGGIVKNCKNTGNISSNSGYVGGIVGYMSSGAIVDSCINTGNISGKMIAGGIIGDNWKIVRNCINTGNVTGANGKVGGIAGCNYAGSPGFGVENCFNMGTVQGESLVGGLTGACDTSTTTSYHSYIANSYNAGSVTATDASGNIGGVSGGIITTSGTGTWTFIHNYYRTGTANLGVFDKTDSESGSTVVGTTVSASTIAGYMNDWLSSNNSEGNYKLWTTKIVNGETVPVPDVGYDW